MSRYKVCVYAICKNEEKFVKTWVESMSEADEIYVMDTGSTDNTVKLFEELGVNVTTKIIKPWRFDVARNESLALVPEDTDICVCTDLDEVLQPGWREKVERAWSDKVTTLRYRYTWNFNPDGSEGVVFWIANIHARHGFKWTHPVHEVLSYSGSKPYLELNAPGVQLDHHADDTKSRGQYLGLLELSVKEDPDDDRNMHYLGREYMFKGMWKECEETLIKHLQMPKATWKDERCSSMRYIARAAERQGKYKDEETWLYRAMAEAPYMREPWLDASKMCARRTDWIGSLYFAEKALKIKNRSMSYINEAESWGALPYDLAALAAYYVGLYDKAVEYGRKALGYEKNNERLIRNLAFYEDAVKTK